MVKSLTSIQTRSLAPLYLQDCSSIYPAQGDYLHTNGGYKVGTLSSNLRLMSPKVVLVTGCSNGGIGFYLYVLYLQESRALQLMIKDASDLLSRDAPYMPHLAG